MKNLPGALVLVPALWLVLTSGCIGEIAALREDLGKVQEALGKNIQQVQQLQTQMNNSLSVVSCTLEESKFLQFIRTCDDEGVTCSNDKVVLALADAFHDAKFVRNVQRLRHQVVYPERRETGWGFNVTDETKLNELLQLPALPMRRFVIVANYPPDRKKEEGLIRGLEVRRYLIDHPGPDGQPISPKSFKVVAYSFKLSKDEKLAQVDQPVLKVDIHRSVWVFYVLC